MTKVVFESKPQVKHDNLSFVELRNGDIVRSIPTGLWYRVCKTDEFTGIVPLDGFCTYGEKNAILPLYYRLHGDDKLVLTAE